MGWRDLLGIYSETAASGPAPRAAGPVQAVDLGGLTQGALADFLRGSLDGSSGVTARTVLRNAAVARCVFLIANAIGMLPLQLLRRGDNSGAITKADDHPLFDVLGRRPNNWQTAFEFRRLMQHRVLVHGNAYALPIRSRGKVTELIPLDPRSVTPRQRADWSVYYEVNRSGGGQTMVERADMLHVMGPSECGLKGMSLVEYAGEVLGLALDAQRAARKLFKQGVMAGGALATDKALSKEAIENLRDSMDERYAGVDNAAKWMVLEQGLKPTPFGTAREGQSVEQRGHQVEEVARLFGVPRPFLMVDDTSWGSGIEQLAIFFVQYGLAPHLVSWEQAIDRVLLTDDERRTLYPKFNERALLRGSMTDQSEFFARALGTGGGRPWMTQDEVRGLSDLAPHGGEADQLGQPIGGSALPTKETKK